MKLYHAPGACSLAPHIVCHELDIAVEPVRVNIRKRTLADGSDYLAINPLGYVPVLELDDGERLAEVPAILQYLADSKPGHGLVPDNGNMERYRLQGWLGFIGTELHKTFGPLFAPDAPEATRAGALARLDARLQWLAPQLEARSFLMGDRFTVADAYLFTVLNWAGFLGVDLSKWPGLPAYVARIKARPAVQAAMRAEGILKEEAAA